MANIINTERFATINQTNRCESKTSNKYSFIPTTTCLDVLKSEGWNPREIKEAGTRKEELKGFQRHIVRLQHIDTIDSFRTVGDEVPEIVLINSHCGASSFQLMAGIFRLVCTNGLVSGDIALQHRITHKGYTNQAVFDALENITKSIPETMDNIKKFKSIQLSEGEQEIFADAAIPLRFDGEKYTVEPSSLLRRRRYHDDSNDLWSTFNRVQENIIKGGVRQRKVNPKPYTNPYIRSRKVKDIKEDIRLNKSLWTLTEKMADIKFN